MFSLFEKCITRNWCLGILVACKSKTRQNPYSPHLAQEYKIGLVVLLSLFLASEYCYIFGLGKEGE